MRNASDHQGENEQGQKKVNSTPYSISSIEHVTRKFLEVSHCRHENQQQRNVQKSVL